MGAVRLDGMRERWAIGETAWFEYHCWESDESADADLWHRTHQPVVVTSPISVDVYGAEPPEGLATVDERNEAAMPGVYQIRFPDGYPGTAWEDELLESPDFYTRPTRAGKPPVTGDES